MIQLITYKAAIEENPNSHADCKPHPDDIELSLSPPFASFSLKSHLLAVIHR